MGQPLHLLIGRAGEVLPAVAEGVDGDAAREVEISLSRGILEPYPIALRDDEEAVPVLFGEGKIRDDCRRAVHALQSFLSPNP